ncbi:phosphatase PAP2 family protein [Patescibacteria group bacterium]|nr:phosphatase PAP2 family protein [Patescibacteria group bacterium]
MTILSKDFLNKRFEKKVFTGLPLTILVLLFLILLATFIGMTDSIVNSYPIVKIDNSFAHYLYTIRNPLTAKILYAITSLANQITIVVFFIAFAIYLYFKKEIAYLYSLVFIFFGTDASIFLIKLFINRTRPGADIAYYIEKSKSFPSGHSAIAMAIFGFFTYYIINHLDKKMNKSLVVSLGVSLIILVGFSRLYLGVHYLSDVLGGLLLGGLWLIAGMTFREEHFYVESLKKGKTE